MYSIKEFPTANKLITVENVQWTEVAMEQCIQFYADDGWDFAGVIATYTPTGAYGYAAVDMLFIRAKDE